MRDEDEVFAEIVGQEFDEQWAPPTTEKAVDPPSHDDFHLNLYDDEESYRQVTMARPLSRTTVVALVFLGLGLVVTVGRFAHLGLPWWAGWCGVGFFVVGVALFLRHVSRSAVDHDDEPQV
ncbi:MAG: hypothetical protein FWG08_05595 [Propionibacteriaceae bacterium]|nr:hypothetical protein [Propionibacteriaceae bacterium]